MARRNSTDENSTDTTTEAPAEAQATEAPAEAKAEEKAVDLTAFTAAVDAAVAEADVTTGDVPEASIAGVTAAYRELEGIKAKNAAKALVNDRMKDRMNSGDLAGARANLNISEKALVAAAGSGGSTPKAPADPTENFVQRVATLQLAYGQAVNAVPEGVKDDWQERVNTLATESAAGVASYTDWLKGDTETRGDEPEVSVVVKNAAKLAQGKSAKAGSVRQSTGGSFDGPRRDIGAHIENAFADKGDGDFLSIADIRNTKSEEYGNELPSAGAISARLFPKSGKSTMKKVGIHPDTQDGKKGARKGQPETGE